MSRTNGEVILLLESWKVAVRSGMHCQRPRATSSQTRCHAYGHYYGKYNTNSCSGRLIPSPKVRELGIPPCCAFWLTSNHIVCLPSPLNNDFAELSSFGLPSPAAAGALDTYVCRHQKQPLCLLRSSFFGRRPFEGTFNFPLDTPSLGAASLCHCSCTHGVKDHR
jgi:hypothetical protein